MNGAVWVVLAALLTTAVLVAAGGVWVARMLPHFLRPFGG
jgi:hypothetical protein